MTSVRHSSFTLERRLKADPARSFHAFADPARRIVFGYAMHVADKRLSASLVTIAFKALASASTPETLMTWTEQVAMFDGLQEVEERIRGTEIGLDTLAGWIAAV